MANAKRCFGSVIARTAFAVFLSLLLLNFEASAQLCNVIYVSPGGSSSGNGSPTNTVDLATAISLAGSTGDVDIRLLSGSYSITTVINLINNVTIDGDYVVDGSTGDWIKSSGVTTTLNMSGSYTDNTTGTQQNIGFKAAGVNNWSLQDLTIDVSSVSGSYNSQGESVYGIYLNGCSNYNITRCAITTGNASGGNTGPTGTDGAGYAGGAGGAAVSGTYNCGYGPSDPCGQTLGYNGNPGSNGDGPGGSGTGGAGGGAGATCASSSTNDVGCGSDGCTGGGGDGGDNGTGGSGIAGTPSSNSGLSSFYIPVQGASGQDGSGGGGGGSGATGGAGTDCDCDYGGTPIGGYGADGGNGGGGGGGGYGGGGSFCIYEYSASGMVTDCSTSAGSGGSGGVGGLGGNGLDGGSTGPTACDNGCGGSCGGPGGSGGQGGQGGQGQTGATGPSYQIYNSSSGSSSGGSVPDPTTVTVNYANTTACSNSEIVITKAAGTWALPTGASFVNDLTPTTSTSSASSNTATISFSATGVYNLGADESTYERYININSTGSSTPTINTIPTINSSTGTLCSGNTVALGTSATGNQYEWLIYSDTINGPASPLQTYSIQNPGNTPAFTVLGKYYVRLRVHTSCCGWSLPVFASFTVVTDPTVGITGNELLCVGSQTTLDETGSSGSYTWSNNTHGTSITVTPDTTTTYSITVTDGNNCTVSASATVTVSTGLNIDSIAVDPILCNGGNGTAKAIVSGGIPFAGGYEYHWSPGSASTQMISNLTPGSYFVTVTDTAGCTANSSVNLSQPNAIVVSNITQGNILCNGANTGTITVFASGGTGTLQYSNNGGTSYQLSSTFNNLFAGPYYMVVKDANGCTTSPDTITITQPASALSVNIDSVSEPSCNGVDNGAIYASASGGAGGYQYSLNGSPLQPGGTFTNLSAGAYNVVVQDANNCQQNTTVTLHNKAGVTLVIDTVYSIACNGQHNGEILVTASRGTEPYSYTDNGFAYQSSDTFSGLNAGPYSIEVKDAAGCTAIQSATVNEPPALTVTIDSVDNISCNGGSGGNIYITANGGTTPYTYSWTGGSTSDSLTGVVAGTYTVTVTDSSNCTATASTTISQPNALYITLANPATVTCYGGSDGSLDISVFGGTPPFTFSWSNGDTLQDATNLPAGPYTLTVTDAANCQLINTFTVNTPSAAINISANVTDITCSGGGNNGSIALTVSGGVTPYSYSWSNNATTSTVSSLGVNTYDVKVTDSLGCTAFASYNISGGTGLTVTLDSTHNVGCSGNTGAIYISVIGGSGSYAYSWTGGSTSDSLTSVAAGTYSVTVTDKVSGCVGSLTTTISGSAPLNISLASAATVTCFGGNNGELQIDVTGGAGPYSFAWSNGQTLQNATNLIAATYRLTVTDANSCQLADTFKVTQPDSALNLSANTTNATCSGGGTNGSITLTVSGGLAPYIYSWSNNATTANLSNLSANTYDVKVTDSLGCTAFASYSVGNGAGLAVILDSTVTAGCSGNSGAIYIGVTGGSGHYAYAWTGGSTSKNLTGVLAGTYTVTVTDSVGGCTGTLTATVSGSSPLNISLASPARIACYRGTNGVLDINVSGGTTPYSFAWSNSQTLQNATNLTAATYSVTVTDAHSCRLADTFTVTQPDSAINLFANLQNATCSGGGSDGSVNLEVTGGVAPYSYNWSDGDSTAQPYSLPPGIYDVKVTDSLGCTAYGSYTIYAAVPPVLTVDSIVNVNCNGNSNGSIYVSITGGTGNFTYTWSDDSTFKNLVNVTAGTYTLTVVNGGCTPTIIATITQPAPLGITLADESTATCFGGDDGKLLLNVTGGTLPYTFAWSNGSTLQDANNLSAGPYRVTLTDAHNCVLADTFTISQPDSALSLSANTTNSSCAGGGADGSITVTVTGGVRPYTYNWSNGPTTSTLSNVSAGTYDVKVTDSLGCTVFASYVVGGTSGLLVSLDSAVNVNCNGNSTGAIYINVSNGSGHYSYSWTGGATTQDITGVKAGTYTVTVSDSSGGCAGILTTTISQPLPLSISLISPATVTCSGGNNGALDINVSGGTAPYTFAWSTGGTLQDATNLPAGPYTVTVTDANTCISKDSLDVSQPASALSISDTITNASCSGGGSDGSIDLTVTGGVSPYDYVWSNSETTSTISSLSAAVYDVKVTDSLGCTVFASYTVGGSAGLTVSLDSVVNVNCNGNLAGAIDINVTGGSGSYGYAWTGGSSSEDLTGVIAGTYTVAVTDSISGCTGTLTETITQPSPLNISLASPATVTCFGGSDGALDINITGGTAPYSFAWSTGGTLQDATDLPAGPYTLTVTDANTCVSTDSFNVGQPASALSISDSITNTSCGGGGGNGSIDLTVTGGVAPYSYLWSNSATTSTISNLTAAAYDVKVTDSLGCTIFASYTVGGSAGLTVRLDSVVNVNCNGNSAGAIYISVVGGSGSYGYTWTGGSSSEDLTGVIGGTYTVTVTDSVSGCTGTLTETITQPAPLSVSLANPATVACFGGSDGALYINVSGGTTPYSFAWSTGGTQQYATDLSAGPYSVTVTDVNNCSSIDTFTVAQPASALSISDSITNVSCSGGDGSITVTVTGGASPYSYSWNNNATTSTISNLAAGTYNLKVTDSLGCTIFASYTVGASTPLTITLDSTVNVDCNGNSTGSIFISVSNGSGFYDYLWTGGATTANLTGVIAGTYTVTVTDLHTKCINTLTTTIAQPTPISISLASPAMVTCFGGNNGALDINVSGGTTPYTFAWSTGGTLQDATDLPAGPYSVTVSDAGNCQSIDSFNVTQPDSALSLSANVTNVSCSGGGSDGAITITVRGGVAPYTYSWNNNATTSTISNLIMGTYTVKVTDSIGCTLFAAITVGSASPLTVTLDSTINVDCNGNSTGAVYISISGGSGSYGYAWTGGSSSEDLTGVIAGTYTVTVTDSVSSCTGTLTATISQPAPLSVSLASSSEVTCFGDNSGNLYINVSGGTAPYSFAWSTGSTLQDVTGLPAGPYAVTVTDAKSCQSVDTFSISQPASVLSISDTITNASCSGGGNNGSVALAVTGGVSPYSYSWNTDATTASISNLTPGVYDLKVTDSLGCNLFASFTIGGATGLTVSLDSVVNVDCNGNSTGSVYINVSGGSGNYVYVWTGGSSSSSLTGVSAGNYTVTVTDNNTGCTGTLIASVSQPAILQATAAITDVSCNGSNNGSISLNVIGGTSPYAYKWSVPGSVSSISGLSANTYQVTVSDANNCSVISSYTVKQPDTLKVQGNVINISCNGGGGDVFLTPTGGTAGYTYNWSNNTTESNITGQTAGTYQVTVTDNNQCSITDSFTITGASSSISVTLAPTEVTCYGDSTGSVTSTVTGAVPTINYLWSNGNTTDSLSNVPAGIYTVVVIDGNGCSASSSTSVNQPDPISLTNSVTDVSCHGIANRSVTVTAKGGVGPYNFRWSTGQLNTGTSSSTISGDTVGSYSLTVTDVNNCSLVASYNITGATAIQLGAQVTNVSCNGSADGAINLSVIGGSGSYSFAWTGGLSTQNISGLAAGPYTVIVTDNIGGCNATLTDTVKQPAPLVVQGSIANVSCAGLNNGEVFLTVTGGTPTYNYKWSNNAVTQDIISVAGNTYTVTVTDNNGCMVSAPFTVIEPQAISLSITGTDVNCNGQSTGSATLTVTGGTSPYNFLWSNFATGQDLTKIPAGAYTVVVTDSAGCTKTDTVTISQNPALVVDDSIADISCFGGSNGSITLTVSGGVPNYSYNWSNNKSTPGVSDLPAGTYSVTVSDHVGCSVIESYPVTQPDSNQVVFTVSNVKCYGGDNGNITVSVNGGVPPYSFKWSDNVNTQNRPEITAGHYQLTFSDANGCSVVDTFDIIQPDSLSMAITTDSATCNGFSNGSAAVTVTGGVTPYTYFWSDFKFAPAISGVPAGAYAVIVTDSNQCTKVDSTVIGQPQVLSVTAQTIDAGCGNLDAGEANASVTGGTPPYTYAWSNNDSTQDINNLPAGTYTLTVEDAHSCDALYTGVILSYPLPVAGFTYNIACAGQPTDFVSTSNISEGTIIYSWYFGDGDSSNQENPVYMYPQPNTYTVELVVKSEHDCTDTISEPVFVSAIPIAGVKINGIQTSSACVGDSAELVLTDTSSLNIHEWSTGQNADSILVNNSGTYTVTVTNPSGCAVSDTVSLKIFQASELAVTPMDTTISLGFSVQLSAIGGEAYVWSPSAGLSDSTIADPVATPLTTTTYTVSIYPDSSCSATRTVTINVENDTLLLPPNFFTPNGDGAHDTWVIANIVNYPICEVSVYNDWGSQVFSTTAYQNNWDGTSGGKPLPDGTYYYLIKCNSKIYKGAVTILR